jgi:hypothetical protein
MANDSELLAASREVDGHALTLNLLGRFLARAHGGDIRHRDLVKFEEADRAVQGGTTFKMLAAFENWFAKSGEFGARQLAVLRMLGLFDRPADSGCIAALREPPVITGLTDPLFTTRLDACTGQAAVQPLVEEDWNMVVSFLSDFGLLTCMPSMRQPVHGYDEATAWQATMARENLAGLRYSLPEPQEYQTPAGQHGVVMETHPLVREYFMQQLRDYNQQSSACSDAHRRVCRHLSDGVPYWPEGLSGLEPLFQAVAHGCQAGLYEEAALILYSHRIQRGSYDYSTKALGAHSSILDALACFFVGSWKNPTPALSQELRIWMVNHAGFCLHARGRLMEAIEAMRAGKAMVVEQCNWKASAVQSGNLCELELTLGDLAVGMAEAEQSVALADRSGDGFQRMSKRTNLADMLHQSGRRAGVAGAAGYFSKAEQIQSQLRPDYPLLHALAGFFFCDFILAQAECVAWLRVLNLPSQRSDCNTAIAACYEACQRAEGSQRAWKEIFFSTPSIIAIALDHLTVGRATLYEALISGRPAAHATRRVLLDHMATAVEDLRSADHQAYVPRSLLSRALFRFLEGDTIGSRADLDEAWDIAERGPMRLHMADIHLHRARLFFREKPYPWKSPQDDLAAAEKLIHDCGYHRRDEELADAKCAILGMRP